LQERVERERADPATRAEAGNVMDVVGIVALVIASRFAWDVAFFGGAGR
jgi:hypothetical protein